MKTLNENKVLLIILITGSLFSAHIYNRPWEWPLIDFFPSIERMLDENFLKNDFTTNTYDDFSARYYVSFFYYYLSHIFEISYLLIVKWVNFLRIFLSIFFSLRNLSKLIASLYLVVFKVP